jgi:hypothetical protein
MYGAGLKTYKSVVETARDLSPLIFSCRLQTSGQKFQRVLSARIYTTETWL